MALKVTTTIRNIHEVDRSDGLEDTYDKLVAAEEDVVREVAHGGSAVAGEW